MICRLIESPSGDSKFGFALNASLNYVFFYQRKVSEGVLPETSHQGVIACKERLQRVHRAGQIPFYGLETEPDQGQMHAHGEGAGDPEQSIQNDLRGEMNRDLFTYNKMSKEVRENRIANIKDSLKKMSIVSKNSLQVEAKEEKIRSRRQSLQLAENTFQSERLMRKFSDQDEEEERTRINSFDQKYRLLDKVGQGGNARVCRCEYIQNGKVYAVKLVRMDDQHYLQLKKNFLNMKMLRHPNIIRYHALYFDLKKHLAYLIMEYFPYKDLFQQELKEENQLRNVLTELLSAISYLHQRNFCHRDIKPENVLYDPNSQKIKLIDFGISKKTFQRGQRRDMLTIIGTPFYLAPQILLGGGYDQKVDLWCTGITLFKLIAGTTPFESEYHAETIDNIIKGEPTFDPAIWDKYTFLLRDLCCRLLKNRKERLSAKQALRHLWLNEGNHGKMRRCSHNNHEEVKFPRHESGSIKMFRSLIEEEKTNVKHAISKEDDGTTQVREPRFLKSTKLNLIENKEFDLSDSSDDQTSPTTSRKSP